MAKKVKEVKSINAKEAEELVISLANAGHSPSRIGLILRDEYGVRNFNELTNKHILGILEENNLAGDLPEDLLNLINKSVLLYNHMKKNNKDFSAKRGYQLTVSKIRKLSKYYIKKKKIPVDWKYTPQKAALLVR
jgi:small subunit ribosomal protein S15